MDDEILKSLDDRLRRLELQAARSSSAPTVPKYDLFVTGGVGGGGGAGVPSFPSHPYASSYAEYVDHDPSPYPTYPTFGINSPIDWTLETFSNSNRIGDGVIDDGSYVGGPAVENAYFAIDWNTKPTIAFSIKQAGFYLTWCSFAYTRWNDPAFGGPDINMSDVAPFYVLQTLDYGSGSYFTLTSDFPDYKTYDTTNMGRNYASPLVIDFLYVYGGLPLNVTYRLETNIDKPSTNYSNSFSEVGIVKL